MGFGIEKVAMLIMKNGKRQITGGIELPNPERVKSLVDVDNYTYL